MDNTNITPLKRSLPPNDLPSPETLSNLLKLSHKRQKLSEIPRSLEDSSSAPILHSVPPTMIPIIQSPSNSSDFFSDLTTNILDPKLSEQINGILKKFPPPIPPYLPKEIKPTEGGIMVPFIYPPPPIIDPDTLPYSVSSAINKKSRKRLVSTINTSATMSNQPLSRENDRSPLSEPIYAQLPPLPFPPPNYMPYPLISDESTLTPGEVFNSFLEASENLPRIDMVVASAAGSLFDMRSQANDEGFTIQGYEYKKKRQRMEMKKKKKQEDENDEQSSLSSNASSDDQDFDEYYEYAKNIDISDLFDYYEKEKSKPDKPTFELNPMPENYINISSRISNIKSLPDNQEEDTDKERIDDEYSSQNLSSSLKSFCPISAKKILSNPSKDIVSANGNNKEKRREELLKSYKEITDYEEKKRFEIYNSRKLQLLQKLKNLQESKISFTNSIIKDEELSAYQRQLEEKRDQELVRLKLTEIYELLKASLIFYQDSNKVYKNLNLILINKLQKLKNFFEFQKTLFNEYLNNENNELFDIRSKDSNKLFNGISDRNFNYEIKEIIKDSINNELQNGSIELLTIPTSNHSATQSPLVHDFMPLISPAEFNLITGDLPNKLKSSNAKDSNKSSSNSKTFINIKHQIFQNPLYDPIASGSDTNTSDSNSPLTSAKRRGRRSGLTSNGSTDKLIDDSDKSKYSETVLLAKIMKHFSGPQAIKQNELNNDLELMGVKTRWPVQSSK